MEVISTFNITAKVGATLAQVIKTTDKLLDNISKSKDVIYDDEGYIVNNAITIKGVTVAVASYPVKSDIDAEGNEKKDVDMFVAWDKKAQGNNQILLSIHIGSTDHTKLKQDLNKPNNFAFKAMLLHEVVHLYQGFKAKEKSYASTDINTYIKNKAEFEAVAYQVAYVILKSGIDIDILRNMQDINDYFSDELEQLFATSFDDNDKLYTAIMQLLQGKAL